MWLKSTEHEKCIFPNFWENCGYSVSQQARLTKIISISSFKVSILHAKFCKIPCNRIRDRTVTRTLGKTEQQRPLLSCMNPNCIIVNSNDEYFVCKLMRNFIHYEPRSAYSKCSEKSMTIATPAKLFSPKVDWHQFMKR